MITTIIMIIISIHVYIRKNLNLNAMSQAASYLIGNHDFRYSNFYKLIFININF